MKMVKKYILGLINSSLIFFISNYCILKGDSFDLSKYKAQRSYLQNSDDVTKKSDSLVKKKNVDAKGENDLVPENFVHIQLSLEDISFYPNLKRLSRGKNTEASSENIDRSKIKHLSAYAVDGNYIATLRDNMNCFHSNRENNPWLLIDLGVTSTVIAVIITNRSDFEKYHTQLKNYNIFVTKQKYPDFQSIPIENRCGIQYNESPGNGAANVVDCKGKVGQYVYVYINDTNAILQLCEVEVFGVEGNICSVTERKNDSNTYKCGENSPSLQNLSRNKKTLASSEFTDDKKNLHSANLGNDGDFRAWISNNKYCFQSKKEDYPWWMVDLNAPSTILAVLILNRLDTDKREQKELLHKYNVMISNEVVDHPKNIPIENRCGDEFLSSVPNEFNFIDCHGKIGRYVYVYTNDTDSSMPLCEVEVFGDTKLYCSKEYTLVENKCVKKPTYFQQFNINIAT